MRSTCANGVDDECCPTGEWTTEKRGNNVSSPQRTVLVQAMRFMKLVMWICIPPLVVLCVLALALPPRSSGLLNAHGRRPTSVPRCDTPFGSLIGVSAGVDAYSNCNSDYTSNESNFVNVTVPTASGANLTVLDVYTGMPWQCVEYARRYWVSTAPYTTFGGVDGASDIWTRLDHGWFVGANRTASGDDKFLLEKHGNNNSTSPPRVGDLLIYPVQPGGFPFGHVAVVVGVTSTTTPSSHAEDGDITLAVHVAEENWDSFPWAHKSEGFSRSLPLTYHQLTKKYSVYDAEGTIAGWVRRPHAAL